MHLKQHWMDRINSTHMDRYRIDFLPQNLQTIYAKIVLTPLLSGIN